MKTEAAARVRAYLARHAKNRQGDPRAIHGYDLGEPSEAELLVADLKLLASPEAPAREGVDAIMSQLADIITEASVDYPAGRDSGHSIDYDEDAIRAVIEAALTPHCEAPAEPVSDHYKFDDEIAWLREAARYFSARDTKGEDRAHWANVYNAENARKLADRLAELSSNPCQLEAPAEGAGEMDDNDASTYAPSVAGLSDYLWNQAQAADSVEGRCILEMWREAVDALRARSSAPEAL